MLNKISVQSVKWICLFCLFTLTNGCSDDDIADPCNGEVADKQFTEQQEELRLNYNFKIGQVIQYKSDSNNVLNFEVFGIDNCPGDHRIGSFFNNSTVLYTYDQQLIRLQIIENDTMQFNHTSKVHYVLNIEYEQLRHSINFPLWNYQFSNSNSQDTSNVSLTNSINSRIDAVSSMTINDRVFNNVIKIESELTSEFSNSRYGKLDQNVNTIFYDRNFGVIRFDEVDGTVWEVVYPEN